MFIPKVVAEYCRAACIFNLCMIHSNVRDKYMSYEYDPDVYLIDVKIYHMRVVYDATEEEIVAALEAMELGPTPYLDLLEILSEFFVMHAATIFTHLQMITRIPKN